MLEQIHAPSEDGRKVQIMTSLATTAFGVFTTFSSGIAIPPAAALGAVLTLMGVGALTRNARRMPRTV